MNTSAVYLVGRLADEPEQLGESKIKITIAVKRRYLNAEGEHDIDYIVLYLWHGIAEATAKYCKPGSLIGIRGRLETEAGDLIVKADKVSILSNGKPEEGDEKHEANTNCGLN